MSEWHKTEGEQITEGDTLIDLETDKVTLEITAPANELIKSILKNPGDVVLTDEVLVTIDTSAASETNNSETDNKEGNHHSTINRQKSTAVERLKENDLKIEQIIGTGKGDRVTKGDVIAKMNETSSSNIVASAERQTEQVPMTRLRKRWPRS